MDTMVRRWRERWGVIPVLIVLAVMAGMGEVPIAEAGDDEGRPTLTVADPSHGCPPISGSFVALLEPGRGMLLLSGAPFPGGRRVGEVNGRPLQAEVGGRTWSVSAVGMNGGARRRGNQRSWFHQGQ